MVDCSVCGWLLGYCPYQVATEKNSPFIRRLPMIRTIAQCFPKPKTTKFFLPALGDGVTFPLIATLKNDATGRWVLKCQPCHPGTVSKAALPPAAFYGISATTAWQTDTQTYFLLFPRGVSWKIKSFLAPEEAGGRGFSCGIFWVNLRDNVDIVSL